MSRIEDIAYTLVRRGNRKRLRRILAKHRGLREEHGPWLLFASLWSNRGLLRWLLARGVQADWPMGLERSNTPLMYAAAEGDVQAIECLVEFGANPHAVNERNENALGFACSWERPDAIRALVEAGVDVNDLTDSGPDNTQLDFAIMGEHARVVDVLRELGGLRYAELKFTSEAAP